MVDALIGFLAFLLLTVLLLGVTVATGRMSRVRAHLACVAMTLVSLGLTIYFAERLGESYDLESAGAIMHVHLAFAKIATLSYVLPAASGIATLRNRSHRKLHFKLAMTTLVLTVAAAVTGTWMILAAEPLPG